MRGRSFSPAVSLQIRNPLSFSLSSIVFLVIICYLLISLVMALATSPPGHPLLHPNHYYKKKLLSPIQPPLQLPPSSTRRHVAGKIVVFRRSDFDGFAKRMASGEAWKDAWRGANDGFEKFLFEAKKATERLDRRYSLSRRLSSVAQSASVRARELDREFEVSQRWRTFSLDFSRNWPRYRKQLNDFLNTPLGKSFSTIFFLWFALSGWLFRFLIFATWILPFAGPLLIGVVANNLIVQGACPACKRQFMGYKNQTIRCLGCGNIVWQPQGGDYFGQSTKGTTPSKSNPDIIDVEYEEK